MVAEDAHDSFRSGCFRLLALRVVLTPRTVDSNVAREACGLPDPIRPHPVLCEVVFLCFLAFLLLLAWLPLGACPAFRGFVALEQGVIM